MTASAKRTALLTLLSDTKWHTRQECAAVGGDRFQARLHESGLEYEYSHNFAHWRLTGRPAQPKRKRQTPQQRIAELEAEVARLKAQLSRVKPQFEFTMEGL